MSQHYSDPKRAEEPNALPDLEVFYSEGCSAEHQHGPDAGLEDECDLSIPGWYYWYCFPGCLPDSEPVGPFATEAEALANAQEDADEEA